ncbi:MAG: hypothetical protein AAB596_02615 [Patescibacteria group bacterium]
MIRKLIYFIADNLIWFEGISVLISLIILWLIVFFLVRTGSFKNEKGLLLDVIGKKNISRFRSVKAWKQVMKRMEANDEVNLKMAIIESDKILDEILKLSGYRGETMADRLKQITSAQISNIEEIWSAHKVRNRIVHEPDFHIPRGEAWMIVEIYKKTLKELSLID